MSEYKIIFTGPAGAGKTTAIASLCNENPTKSGVTATNISGMDYGTINLGDAERIHLYGTSSDISVEKLPDIYHGGIGLILLIDNTRPDPFHDMRHCLDIFRHFIAKTHVAIGITHMDLNNRHSIEDYHQQLKPLAINPPVFTVDARQKHDVSLLIQALLYAINPGFQAT